MSITLFTDSGKAAVIELEKEIEVSATKAALVTVELVFEAKAAVPVEVLVNKEVVSVVVPGEPTAASKYPVTFEVAAGQKYEVKKAAKLKEALASVALEQNQIASSDVEDLLAEGTAAAVVASGSANETVRETNAKILGIGKLNYQGAYSATTTYTNAAVVSFEGGSYELLKASALNEPPTKGVSNTIWVFR